MMEDAMPPTSTADAPLSAADEEAGTVRDGRPRALGSSEELSQEQLAGAPVRWPRPSLLERRLEVRGKKMAAGLDALGLHTVGELLGHLPSDRRSASTIAGLREGEQATVAVRVRRISARPVRRRGMRPLVEARVADATGSMRATFFNQPWLVERYPEGTDLLLHGTADGRGGFRVSHHALSEPSLAAGADANEPAAAADDGGAVAHYPAAEGITSTQILTLVRAERQALYDVPEVLPGALRAGERLPSRRDALAAMHFPRGEEESEAGRRRLAFEELLLTQLAFLRRRHERRTTTRAPALAGPGTRSASASGGTPSLSARWLRDGLPFAPTADQLQTIETIAAELGSSRPMQRLLMGEVGSGKTVVALHAMLRAVEEGLQGALMAPTETLAEQHFATIQRLLGGEQVQAALLTGSTPAARRRDILGKLASGELRLVVGTHALIEPDVRFAALAVAVVDEQHRFGVRQRAALEGGHDGLQPHVLHMTATPIPRTLALAQYGDLDVSTLRELPVGRQPVRTRLVAGAGPRERAYEELRRQLGEGRQAYVVCPLIEEPDDQGAGTGELRAAKAELVRLREGELRGFSLALLHGGMRAREKQEAMAQFASGAAQVLVATTVIEVGIDVANATVMLIENAERFGISQLHQLRGRVGRGEHPAVCFLAGPPEAAGSPRLRALAKHGDGFRLAQIDLELRREGELIGARQSGAGAFRVARLPGDEALLERARAWAERIMAADPELAAAEHVLLREALRGALPLPAPQPLPA
jgi:ATP-dependent DNA helicase RecG